MTHNQPDDPIAEAYRRMKQLGATNAGNKDTVVPRRKPPMGSSVRRGRGRPTGKDGRALPPKDRAETFSAVLSHTVSTMDWSKKLAGGLVFSHWEELVGERIAQNTKVEMLKGTTLFISCTSTAWATNLRLMQKQILSAIATKVGPDVITEMKIFGPQVPSWRFGRLHVKGRGPRDTYG